MVVQHHQEMLQRLANDANNDESVHDTTRSPATGFEYSPFVICERKIGWPKSNVSKQEGNTANNHIPGSRVQMRDCVCEETQLQDLGRQIISLTRVPGVPVLVLIAR
jgi:hypothetical protein